MLTNPQPKRFLMHGVAGLLGYLLLSRLPWGWQSYGEVFLLTWFLGGAVAFLIVPYFLERFPPK